LTPAPSAVPDTRFRVLRQDIGARRRDDEFFMQSKVELTRS
jgi:hypothetical protein